MAFDPDAYLADIGKPAPKTSGFDPDAYLAGKGAPPKRFPWEAEAAFPEEDRIGRANAAYAANVEALPADKAAAERAAPASVTGNIGQMARNFAGGVKALGRIGNEAVAPTSPAEMLQQGPFDPLIRGARYLANNPETRRELERGLSDTITFGLAEKAGQKAGEAVGDTSLSPDQAAADAAAAPDARAAGAIAGSFAPSPARFVAQKVGGMVPGTGVLPGAARSVAQYEATAPVAAAIQAPEGQGLQAAYDAATDPAGLTVAGVTGAVGGAIARAPERVKERGTEALSRGEAGGTANAKIARKATAVAGEGGEDLYAEIGNDTRLEAGQSILAKSNPGMVAKMYDRRIKAASTETEPFYQAIDDAPDPRFADPKKAPRNGGIDLGRVQTRLEASRDTALKQGRGFIADAYDKALSRLRGQYGTDGAIVQGEKLPARSMRNYANEVGRGLLPATDDPQTRTLAQQAQRAIYRDVVGAIEDEGERVGLDMTELRKLNRKISTFISARDALADRAVRAQQGHTTLGNALTGATLLGGGMAGGLEGVVAGAAIDATRRAMMPVARTADFALAKLVQASRAGAAPAQLVQMALQLGLSQEAAARIAKGGVGAYEEPASERDYTQP